jgi:hypothetical protein
LKLLLEEELKVERRKLQEIAERTPAEIIEREQKKKQIQDKCATTRLVNKHKKKDQEIQTEKDQSMSVSEAEPTINNNVLVETSLAASINENPQLNSSDSESELEKITDSHFNVSSKRNKRIKLNYKKLKTNRTDIQQNDTHTHTQLY